MSVIANNIVAGAAGQGGDAYQISRSLRFNSADSAYLSRTPSSAGDRRTWTWSGWVKRSKLGVLQQIFGAGQQTTNDSIYSYFRFDSDDKLNYRQWTDSVSFDAQLTSTAVFRDTSAWFHLVFAYDSTQSTDADKVKIYVNGTQIEDFDSNDYPGLNSQAQINNTKLHTIGSQNDGGTQSNHFDGYLADVYFIDGQALAPTDFGEYDDDNVWQPKAYSGTYGTNGFHLDFSDNTSTTTIAEDSSGNNNDFTANNLSVASGAGNDSLIDTPTNYTAASGNNGGNYCTWNPLHTDTSNNFNPTLSNGNLDCSWRITDWNVALGTQRISSGKWYWEITLTAGSRCMIGITKYNTFNSSNAFYYSSDSYSYFSSDGNKRNGSASGTSYGATFAQGDVIGVALDLDAGTLIFYKNGTSQGTAFTGLSGNFTPLWASDITGNTGSANFGQRPFAISSVPAGHKSLCTTNLTDPTIADGSTAMDVALWTGNGTTQGISGLNFSPDFACIKRRSSTCSSLLYDTVRGSGPNKGLISDSTTAEGGASDNSTYGYLSSFDFDGFSLVAGSLSGYVNTSGQTYVGWAWDGGPSTVSNTDGSITSSVRANPSAGFSIVTWTVGTAPYTVGHGLNAEPYLIITKSRTGSSTNWSTYHKSTGNQSRTYLNLTLAASSGESVWNNTTPTSSVFSLGSSGEFSGDMVAYCFAPVAGYSAFGSYTGNGSSDGPFVYTGFRPRYLLTKASSAAGTWIVRDTERDEFNSTTSAKLAPNYSYEENNSSFIGLASQTLADFLSNGFKVRSTGGISNDSGVTYVWAAFAEHPFKTARAR